MPYQLSLHPHLVHVQWHGILIQEEVDAFLREIPRLAQQLGYLPDVLHTFAGVNALQLSMPMQWRRPVRGPSPFTEESCRTAIIANRPMLQNVERMFRQIPDGPALEVRRFGGRDEALDWLLTERIEANYAAAGA